jgi:murein DD-endopeptidase MepM/ murein hydrolase activator NlpD
MSWQSFYKKTTNPFGTKGPFYGPAGHHGADFAVGSHGAVPAYFNGTLVLNGHSSVLGNYSVYRADGAYLGFAHLLAGTRRDVGSKVTPGQSVGLAAGRKDDHGTAWSGPHCHTTRSAFETGIYDGRTVDPVPRIRYLTGTLPAATKAYTRVRLGEGGIKVAARVGLKFPTLQKLNPGVNMNRLRPAQKLRIK